jgi:hypothetical protein
MKMASLGAQNTEHISFKITKQSSAQIVCRETSIWPKYPYAIKYALYIADLEDLSKPNNGEYPIISLFYSFVQNLLFSHPIYLLPVLIMIE